MVEQVCTKCGFKTNYEGDLHCRKIFISEINELITLKELEKARILFSESVFDEKWKEAVLNKLGTESRLGNSLKEEIWQIKNEKMERDIKRKHQEYLKSLGIDITTIAVKHNTNIVRCIAHCYNCKEHIDNSFHVDCGACGWVICRCGACGCGYE